MAPLFRSILFASCVAASGCAVSASHDASVDAETGDDQNITKIPTGTVKDQSETGNCWLYATTAWIESLSADPASGNVRELSTAYLVYWNFYDQILASEKGFAGVEWTGGSWGEAAELVLRYGMVPQYAFTGERSADADAKIAVAALTEVNTALKKGALRTRAARKDPARVRRVLDQAFRLSPDLVAALDNAFGPDGQKTFDEGAVATGAILSPDAIRVHTPTAPGQSLRDASLRDAIGTHRGDDADDRSGPLAWSHAKLEAEADAAKRPKAMRAFFKRIQRALHDGVPVPISWCVDDDGKDGRDRYTKPVSGLEDECAHETLVTDYEAKLPDGRILQAGEPASREDMERALGDDVEILFLRVKNSWGLTDAPKSGYTDLFPAYLASSLRSCPNKDEKSEDCQDYSFLLDDVALPPGY